MRTCAEAGPAMQRELAARRQVFVDAVALDNEKTKLAQATAFVEANAERFQEIEARMEALAERCADDAVVKAVFEQMKDPTAGP